MPLLSRKAAPKALAAAAITDYEALSISITKPDGCSDSGLTFADVATNNGPRAPFVYGVKPGGPASGKLHDGDRVWCINGKEVKTAKAAATLMRNAKGVVELQVMRPNDMRRALELSLAEEQGGARSEERDMEEALAASLGDEPPSASDSADMDEALTLSLSAAPATGSVVDDDELERALAESLREQSMGDEDEMLRLALSLSRDECNAEQQSAAAKGAKLLTPLETADGDLGAAGERGKGKAPLPPIRASVEHAGDMIDAATAMAPASACGSASFV